jgi:hypothetical protein
LTRENEPKPDWKPGTDTIADRPGSFLERGYGKRQRPPDDLEAQEERHPIAIHALENLAHSDTGVVMLRRSLREQLKRIDAGGNIISIAGPQSRLSSGNSRFAR